MCDPVTAGAVLAGAFAAKSLAPKPPDMSAPTTPTAPQQALAPQVQNKGANMEGAGGGVSGGGVASTLLTGAAGVDPSSLKLGKQTLLGM